jgi:NADP-dependent 3-hydroxy acid dehydrogenase YdfG
MEQTQQDYHSYLPADIDGKSVIVTGGTTGIGRATAILLAGLGANVLVVGEDPAHLQDTINSVEDEHLKGSLTGLTADLATEDGIDRLFAMADKQFDRLDILVNNAALAYQGVQSGNYQEWQKVINTNLLGYIACTGQAVERMKKHKDGHIINIGSMSADVREKDSSIYVATKSGIQGFSESLRKEVNEVGIKVSLIEPGAVGTDMQPVSVEDQREKEQHCEMLMAEDIAAAVLYVVSQPRRCDVVDLKIRPHLQLV